MGIAIPTAKGHVGRQRAVPHSHTGKGGCNETHCKIHLKLVADLTANSVSSSQIESISGYLQNWDEISFDDKRRMWMRWFPELKPPAPSLLYTGKSKNFCFSLYHCQRRFACMLCPALYSYSWKMWPSLGSVKCDTPTLTDEDVSFCFFLYCPSCIALLHN